MEVENGVLRYFSLLVRPGDTIMVDENGESDSFRVVKVNSFDLHCLNSRYQEVRILIEAFKYGKYSIIDVSSN